MDLQLQMAQHMIILNRFLEREVCSPHQRHLPVPPHFYLTRCWRGEASYMSKSCNAAGHQSEIQYEITADSAMRLWQQGQHGQQQRGHRGGSKRVRSVALSFWFWLNAHNREFSSKQKAACRAVSIDVVVVVVVCDKQRRLCERTAGKTRRQETRRRFKADPTCATHRTSEPFHTSIRAQPQRQFS